jgi:hypothetical protein
VSSQTLVVQKVAGLSFANFPHARIFCHSVWQTGLTGWSSCLDKLEEELSRPTGEEGRKKKEYNKNNKNNKV